ncbi:MAG: hypothetical protein EBT20_05170 [Alphaproteobacteria bacterium]|jgi:hypothetical protein|nr:hypothetical protein [Alphaproteobacteria bacterium]
MLTKFLITGVIIAIAIASYFYGRGRKSRQVDGATRAAQEATRRRVEERLNLKQCSVCEDYVAGRCHREDCGHIE